MSTLKELQKILADLKSMRKTAGGKGGKSKSPKKLAAIAINAKKGGRPNLIHRVRFTGKGEIRQWSTITIEEIKSGKVEGKMP